MDKLSGLSLTHPASTLKPVEQAKQHPTKTFESIFKEAIQLVNEQQIQADHLTQQLITGEIQDVHQVMIAAQKANLSLNLTVQVRNKIVESYQEIMRMQV